jgi:hypothetical protein
MYIYSPCQPIEYGKDTSNKLSYLVNKRFIISARSEIYKKNHQYDKNPYCLTINKSHHWAGAMLDFFTISKTKRIKGLINLKKN